jgi:PKD repeat protein
VLDCLQASAVNINNANPNFIGQLGAGRINAQAALECANASALVFDAGVSQILFPSSSTCETSFQPSITIRNTGQTTLTSLVINLTLDGVNAGTFTWTGNLPSQQSTNVTLPSINAGIGSHILQICSSTMNTNQADTYSLNNCQTLNFQVISPEGANLPFIETFESNSLSTNGWTLINSDNAETWEIVTTQGASPGTRSARIPFFTYASTGQRDALITPSFNFAIYTDIEISFEHAYRRYQAGVSDSLIVSLSTDCGATYPHRIFVGGENGTGSFATQSISTTAFVPASPDDWCSGPIGSECVTIDLTPFAGNSGVRIKFEGYNNYGNNLYLDNINITGSLAGAPATANFSVAGSQVVCQGASVQFTNLSGNAATNYSWTFPGGQPAVSQAINPSILYNQPGVYEVSLTSSNQFGQDTEVKTGFIQVVAAPSLGVSINPPATCQGNPVAISASGAQNYAWSPAVAISNSSGPGITANPPQTTVYTLTGTNAQGCSSAIDFTVQVYPNPPQPQISLQSQDVLVASNGTGYQWYLNGNPINGAVFQEFSPQQSGNYTVEVFDSNGCSSNSEAFNYDSNILSQDLILNTAPFIYPNPAEGLIQIAHVSGSFTYSIFASDGKLVMSGQSDKNAIDLNGVAPGIYQIILSQNNQLVPLRFVLKPGFN